MTVIYHSQIVIWVDLYRNELYMGRQVYLLTKCNLFRLLKKNPPLDKAGLHGKAEKVPISGNFR